MGFWRVLQSSRAVLGMLAVQIAFAGLAILAKMALNRGLPFYVFVVYRHAVAAATLSPFAYFLERKTRPKLTRTVLAEIFVSALLGSTLNHGLYYAALRYISPTIGCALGNMIPAITFLMAVALRLERLSPRTPAGQAKLLGTIASIGGGMLITFYKGPAIPLPFLESSTTTTIDHQAAAAAHVPSSKVLTGVLLTMASNVVFSAWFVVQAKIGSNYCAQYSSTALMCLFATAQAGSASLVFQLRNPDWHAWKLPWDSRLVAILYSGVVGTGISFSLMSWVIRKKGPLIVTMYNPLQLVIVALMSTAFLHEKLHLGSVVSSVLIMIGLYAVMWGKSREMNTVLQSDKAANISEEEAQSHHITIGTQQEQPEQEQDKRKHDQKTVASEDDDDEANGKHKQDGIGGVGVVVVDMVQQQRRTEDGGVPRVGAT